MNDLMAFLLMRQRLSSFLPSYSAPLEAEEAEDEEDLEDEDEKMKGAHAPLEEPRLPGDIMGGMEMPDYSTTRKADDDFWPLFFEHMSRFFPTTVPLPGTNPLQRPEPQIIESEASEPIDVFHPVYRALRQARLASAIGRRGRRI